MSKVTITISGPVGCAKSALLGEIEILMKALGVPVSYADEAAARAEKNATHADWTDAIEMYKPSVVLVEHIERAAKAAQGQDGAVAVVRRVDMGVVVDLNDRTLLDGTQLFTRPQPPAAMTEVIDAAKQVIKDWDGEPEDMQRLQLAIDAAIAAQREGV